MSNPLSGSEALEPQPPFILNDPAIAEVFERTYNPPTIEDPVMLQAMDMAAGDPLVAREVYGELRHLIEAMAVISREGVPDIADEKNLYYQVVDIVVNRIDQLRNLPDSGVE